MRYNGEINQFVICNQRKFGQYLEHLHLLYLCNKTLLVK